MFEELTDGLKWMGRTVSGHVEDAVRAVLDHDLDRAARVVERDARVNLANDRLQDVAFQSLADGSLTTPERNFLRAAIFVSQNMERVGDCAVSIAKRAPQLLPNCMTPEIAELIAESIPVMRDGLTRSLSACLTRRLSRARDAMRCETRLDQMFARGMDLLRQLDVTEANQAAIPTLTLVLKYLEKIGDAVQNMCEQAIFLVTGQRLKYGSLVHLERMLGKINEDARFRNLFDGRSGARVGQIQVPGREPLLFKHDRSEKIVPEVRKSEQWNRWIPGITPQIRDQLHRRGDESFLADFLESRMLQNVLLDVDADLVERALRRLLGALESVWAQSARPEPPTLSYVRQIRDRLEELFRMHPFLAKARAETLRFGDTPTLSLEDTLRAIESREQTLAPPASAWIHGDLNPDNIFYDVSADRIHFIDVHRSGWGDYAQDISVLMVGVIRNPMYSPVVRRRLVAVNESIHAFGAGLARRMEDGAFEFRLRLARGRSLITSGRLIAEKRFARQLFLQGMRLLDTVADELAATAPE